MAAIFPLLWAGVTREIAPSRPAAVGPLFAAGGVGGAVLPWLVGVVSTGYGLDTGLLVPLAALLVMLIVFTVPGPVKNVKGPSVLNILDRTWHRLEDLDAAHTP